MSLQKNGIMPVSLYKKAWALCLSVLTPPRSRMKLLRTATLVIAASAVLVASLPAEARFGGGTSSSHASPSFSRGGGLSAGNSIGMSRPSVAASVRNGTATNVAAPRTTTTTQTTSTTVSSSSYRQGSDGRTYNTQGQYYNPQTHSWVMPALAGAAVGYGVARLTEPHGYAGGGMQPLAQPGYAAPQAVYGSVGGAPMTVTPVMMAPRHGFLSFLVGILLILAIGAFIVILYRKFGASAPSDYDRGYRAAPSFGDEEERTRTTRTTRVTTTTTQAADPQAVELDGIAKQIFRDLQMADARRDVAALKNATEPAVFDALRPGIEERTSDKEVVIDSLTAKVVDVSQTSDGVVASVHYVARIREDGQSVDVNEIWNFVKAPGQSQWKVAGVDQV
ncbi:Tim44 domain-containing protein [Paraburkholderia sp. UCT31]|uniref:Tim44 domain-containing protein n=1 Tax=Paraburkholderia sp. UCT31 TaxID=2615209 RepID=UPI00165624B3|nr:Tim44-like domain-containing protein [Paraburkholderia sp. UCT31]MBC8737380.1 Tim44 domain-containing protein [Paraburkholderia sp. UCT31]